MSIAYFFFSHLLSIDGKQMEQMLSVICRYSYHLLS